MGTMELGLGGWTFSLFAGWLLDGAKDPIWFRIRLSWAGGRPGADHGPELYPE